MMLPEFAMVAFGPLFWGGVAVFITSGALSVRKWFQGRTMAAETACIVALISIFVAALPSVAWGVVWLQVQLLRLLTPTFR